ncbi:peptidyl-prolyl cis-trans isomerase [Pueribacillus sp. YX66]|uniref:peptidyl-prolyl cis-trans isomerase n=1 Tax=Pueribacillus sp. YX66 TaxID=3229242 RepID=UPI00358D87A7
MSDIIQFSGDIEYKITLDPSVWIFDDRKIELDKAFDIMGDRKLDDLESYTKKISKQWDKERSQGASFPPVNRSVQRMDKDKVLTETYVMPIQPFINNAEPAEHVETVSIVQKDGTTISIALSKIKDAFLCFSKNGKPLTKDGPVHLYFRDGSNRNKPIKNITEFVFK